MSGDAQQLKEEGLRLFQDGAYPEALEHFTKAEESFTAAGEALGAAEMFNNIGVIHRMEGRTAEASTHLEKARTAFKDIGDKDREAQTLGNLAPLYSKQDQIEKAIDTYREAALIFAELGDEDKQGEILMAQGLLQFDNGDKSGGLALYELGIVRVKNPTGQQKRARFALKMRQKLLGS